jgi:hypothetical protein
MSSGYFRSVVPATTPVGLQNGSLRLTMVGIDEGDGW